MKRFASSEKRGRLCVYERGKPPRTGSPKGEGSERGFFTGKQQDGKFDDRPAESWAQKIEDRALDVLIHAANSCFIWTQTNRKCMAEYWSLLFVRSTAFFEFHRKSWEKGLVDSAKRIVSDGEARHRLALRYSLETGRLVTDEDILSTFSRLIPSLSDEREMRDHYVQALHHRVTSYSHILLNKPWQIWQAQAGSQFVTCDSPVMTFRLDEWGRYYVGNGLAKEGTVVLLPLSPTACLFAGFSGYPVRLVGENDIREVNKIVISSCSRFVYSQENDVKIDLLVQEFGGTTRYGENAFNRTNLDDLAKLFL